eukprot:scaffold57632_cov50-Phaeocystis_antarctica.AAC.1
MLSILRPTHRSRCAARQHASTIAIVMLTAYTWPRLHACFQITLRSAMAVCPHSDCIIALQLGPLRPSVFLSLTLGPLTARVARRQCASTIAIAMLSLRKAAARLPTNDLAIRSCCVSTAIASLLLSLALRPSVFAFFGPLTFRVTRRAACLKFIAIALCSAYGFVARRCLDSLVYLPPVSRGATAYLIALNLATALLSTNDWTRRDCPHAVQAFHAPNCAPLYVLYGMLAARAAVSACMPSTIARLSTCMLQSCCHSNLVNLSALAERTVFQPTFHRWLSFHMLYSHLCDRPTRQAPYGWSCSIEESYKLTDQLQSEVGLLSTNIGNGARLCSRAEPDDMSEEFVL